MLFFRKELKNKKVQYWLHKLLWPWTNTFWYQPMYSVWTEYIVIALKLMKVLKRHLITTTNMKHKLQKYVKTDVKGGLNCLLLTWKHFEVFRQSTLQLDLSFHSPLPPSCGHLSHPAWSGKYLQKDVDLCAHFDVPKTKCRILTTQPILQIYENKVCVALLVWLLYSRSEKVLS